MKSVYSQFYTVFESAAGKIAGILTFVALISLTSSGFIRGVFPGPALFLLSWAFIVEVFYHFKVLRFSPKSNVAESVDPLESFTIEALHAFSPSPKVLLKKLLSFQSVRFLLEKAGISSNEIKEVQVDLQQLAKYAVEVSKSVDGKYVTTADLAASYLLLSEPVTKLLFSKKLKQEEFLEILAWTRNVYKGEEQKPPLRAHFSQEGIGEALSEGWTIETKKYMKEIVPKDFKRGSEIVGRDKEYKEAVEAFYEKKGVLFVAEEGSGRTAIVEKLALDSFSGNLKGKLYHKRFFELMLDAILGGAENQGALQERLNNVIQEVSHSGNSVVIVKEFENIAGGSSFKLNLLDTFLPYIREGKLQVIGFVTPGAYKKYIEPVRQVQEVMKVIKLEEADRKLAMYMLFAKSRFLEEKHKVKLTYKAIAACVEYGKTYMPEISLPGCAVVLLEDTSAACTLVKKKVVEEGDIVKKVEEKAHVKVAEPTVDEKNVLLGLESEIHKRVIGQDEAVAAVSEALRRIRTGMTNRTKPVSFLFLGPTGVGKTETAKALARVYFESEDQMIRLDMSEYSGADALKRLLGDGDQKGLLSEPVYENPSSLILLDEFEKANSEVLNTFLQVLDDGRLTDNFGKTVSFVNSIIIATSNAVSEFIREEVAKDGVVDTGFREKLLEFLQTKAIFSPELLNRFDEVVVFKPLTRQEVKEVAKILLKDFIAKMQEKDIKVSIYEKVLEKIAKEGFNEQFGARPIRRYVQDNIEDAVAQKMLKNEIKRGSSATISVDSSGNISII